MKASVNTQRFSLDSKISDLINDASALQIAKELAPNIFDGEQGKILAGLPFSIGQLCDMSGSEAAEAIKKLLKEINKRLGKRND